MTSQSENQMEKQKKDFELFLLGEGIKSFKQYSSVIGWKMCRDRYGTTKITPYKNLFACTDPKKFDEITPELLNNPLFLKDKNHPTKGKFGDHVGAIKQYSIFLHRKKDNLNAPDVTKKLSSKRMIVIDMNSGSYTQDKIGHEVYNLAKNPIDGQFYGYCPPYDNIDICKRFGAKSRTDSVCNILVVYVTKKAKSNNREIIGFMPNANVFGEPQSGDKLSRTVFDEATQDNKTATYSIKGDTLIDLRGKTNKFEIEIAKYNSYIFRGQRYYGSDYPELDKKIIDYLDGMLKSPSDDIDDQEEIQKSEPATTEELHKASNRELVIISNGQGKKVVKDGRISKAALERERYICQMDSQHATFQTTRGMSYMEGHHIIPCTASNAEYFKNQNGKHIDCLENIVCLCPTCHRAVHFGDRATREKLIRNMYSQQAEQLVLRGITITEEDLLALYKCN